MCTDQPPTPRASRLQAVLDQPAPTRDVFPTPAVVLRVHGRGDDPLMVVLEWHHVPSQVTLATSARTLVTVLDEHSASSLVVATAP